MTLYNSEQYILALWTTEMSFSQKPTEQCKSFKRPCIVNVLGIYLKIVTKGGFITQILNVFIGLQFLNNLKDGLSYNYSTVFITNCKTGEVRYCLL